MVSGATSGIGEATARLLAEQGSGVVVSGRREDRVRAIVAAIESRRGDGVGVPGDVTNGELVAELFAAAERRWAQPPDVFVLCAGRGLPGTVLTSDPDHWRALVEVNYLAVLTQLRACASRFLLHAESERVPRVRDIVIVGSTTGREVSGVNPVYGSTKFAVHSIAEGLRREVCAHAVRVTLVEPGFVKSNFQQSAGYEMRWFRSVEERYGPLLEPEDVARTIAFVIGQPPHVHLDDIRMRPTRQEV